MEAPPGFSGSPFYVYVGGGGYEGLTALVQLGASSPDADGRVQAQGFEGIIIEAPAPGFPDAQEMLASVPEMLADQ